ncbi:hypothetical protein ABIA35_004330 [Catenulispora sp. MAP12-49]
MWVWLGWVAYRRFLTASRMVYGIHWWRGSGVALVSRGGGGVGRWLALLRQSRTTAKAKANCENQGQGLKAPPAAPTRRAASAPGMGAALAAAGRCLWSPRPGFPVASSPNGSRPVRWYQAGSPSWWPGISDLTPPARPAWLRPPKRRGIRDKPTCGKSSRASRTHRPAAAVSHRVDRVHTTDRGCPGFPVASAVLAQPSRPGRCPAERNRWPATVIRLDTAQAGMVPSGRRSGGESGTKATTSSVRRPTARPPLPGARPLAAQAPPEALFSS